MERARHAGRGRRLLLHSASPFPFVFGSVGILFPKGPRAAENPGNISRLPRMALPHQLIKVGPSQSDGFAGRLRV